MSAPIAAENLAQAIRQVAKRAHSEEDLRVGVEHALGATLQALGLTATPEYEKTTLSGSADAVYGHAVITHLAALSQQAHQLAAAGDEAGLAAVEAQVDEAAAELWSITDRELKEIRRSLEELG